MPQRHLGVLTPGDVRQDTHRTDDGAIGTVERGRGELQVERGPIPPLPAYFGVGYRAAPVQLGQERLDLRSRVGIGDRQRQAEHLVGPPAQGALGGGVPALDQARGVDGDDRQRRGTQDRPQVELGPLRLRSRRPLRRIEARVAQRLGGALGEGGSQAEMVLGVEVRHPAAHVERARQGLAQAQGDGDHAPLPVGTDQRRHGVPCGVQIGVGLVAGRGSALRQPQPTYCGRRSGGDAGVAPGCHEGGHAILVERDPGMVAGEHPDRLPEDRLIEPLGLQRAGQGDAYLLEGACFLRLILDVRVASWHGPIL